MILKKSRSHYICYVVIKFKNLRHMVTSKKTCKINSIYYSYIHIFKPVVKYGLIFNDANSIKNYK